MFARAFPFALFIALIALQPLLDGRIDTRWLVIGRGLLVGVVLVSLWPRFVELQRHPGGLPGHPRDSAAPTWMHVSAAIAVGVLVFIAWIHLDQPWNSFDMGRGFVPVGADGTIDTALVALRLAGLALVVPVMEELFWRSFLMRWIDARDFLAMDPRQASRMAFALSCGLFALEHAAWFAGLLAGAAYGWLYIRTARLWIPITAHAITNATLGFWILATGNWRFW